jgi:ABC-type Fe3+/spermidine/putrescine transport system ATPase subunit
MAGAPLLDLLGVAKQFGGAPAVHPLSLTVDAGDFCAILGPSGCGKSTLLRMIGGFLAPDAGRILIDGVDVTDLPPERRPTNMVFQGYGLFPHLTVAQNVGFGLSLQRLPRGQIAARVADALALVRLTGFDARLPAALSGGQQQRVALARALIMRPKVLLLDEPLAALDLKLRHQMQDELRRIHADIGGTFLFVTHDQGEAFGLATRVAVMNQGRIAQVGPPQVVHDRPATLFVADFVGEATRLRGVRQGGQVTLTSGPVWADPGPDGPVVAVIRPGRIIPVSDGLAVTVADATYLGGQFRVTARTAGGEEVILLTTTAPAPGDRLTIGWPQGAAHLVADA